MEREDADWVHLVWDKVQCELSKRGNKFRVRYKKVGNFLTT